VVSQLRRKGQGATPKPGAKRSAKTHTKKQRAKQRAKPDPQPDPKPKGNQNIGDDDGDREFKSSFADHRNHHVVVTRERGKVKHCASFKPLSIDIFEQARG
jgi:hypothetical protein